MPLAQFRSVQTPIRGEFVRVVAIPYLRECLRYLAYWYILHYFYYFSVKLF
jgi:hypothetical protein